MKKIILLFCLLAGLTFFGFKDVKPSSVEIIEFYGNSQNKSLNQLIKETYEKSKIPIVYFYADWCGPCLAFKKNLDKKQVLESLTNATLIKINVDEDVNHDEIHTIYSIKLIPTFIKVDINGDVVAEITSDKWDKDVPKSIAPVMNDLVNENVYDQN